MKRRAFLSALAALPVALRFKLKPKAKDVSAEYRTKTRTVAWNANDYIGEVKWINSGSNDA